MSANPQPRPRCYCGLAKVNQPGRTEVNCPVHGPLTEDQLRFRLGYPPRRCPVRRRPRPRPAAVVEALSSSPELVRVEAWVDEGGQGTWVEA